MAININSTPLELFNEHLATITTDDITQGLINLFDQDSLTSTTQTLTFASPNTATDFSNGHVCNLTVTGDTNMSAPTNVTAGNRYHFFITQDGSGGHSVTFDAVFQFKTGVGTSIAGATAEAGSVTLIECISPDGTNLKVLSTGEFAS